MTTTPNAAAADEGAWERRRRLVAGHIETTAIALFARHGYRAITVADVAAAAHVSARTVARYFPLKEDLLLEVPRRRRRETVEAMASLRGSTDPVGDTIDMFKRLAALHQGDLADFSTWMRAIETAPEMRGRAYGDLFLESAEALTELVAESLDVDPAADLRAGVLASAVLAAVDAATRFWMRRGATDDWQQLLDDVHAALVETFAR